MSRADPPKRSAHEMPAADAELFAQHLDRLVKRRFRGVYQRFAWAAEIGGATVDRIKTREANPAYGTMLAIARALACPIVYLVAYGNEPIDELVRVARAWGREQLRALIAVMTAWPRGELAEALEAMRELPRQDVLGALRELKAGKHGGRRS